MKIDIDKQSGAIQFGPIHVLPKMRRRDLRDQCEKNGIKLRSGSCDGILIADFVSDDVKYTIMFDFSLENGRIYTCSITGYPSFVTLWDEINEETEIKNIIEIRNILDKSEISPDLISRFNWGEIGIHNDKRDGIYDLRIIYNK